MNTMTNLNTTINTQIDKDQNELYQYFTEEELTKTAKELAYIKKHPEEYKRYKNSSELKEALLKDK